MQRLATTQKVLVTGSAGTIGQATCRELKARGHAIVGIDLRETPGVDECVVATLEDREAVDRAVSGVTTVVHLAADPIGDDFLTKLIPNNVISTYNIFEAALEAGVKRFIYASSIQVVTGHLSLGSTVRLEDGPAAVNYYALFKLWGEQLGEMMWRKHGLSFIGVRIGYCPRARAGSIDGGARAQPGDVLQSRRCRAVYGVCR